MTTRVRLFVSMKNESVARPLGVRQLRHPPASGQQFQIPIDGRSVHVRIARLSGADDSTRGRVVPRVYADEI
jgi:hypothetical protein